VFEEEEEDVVLFGVSWGYGKVLLELEVGCDVRKVKSGRK